MVKSPRKPIRVRRSGFLDGSIKVTTFYRFMANLWGSKFHVEIWVNEFEDWSKLLVLDPEACAGMLGKQAKRK